jgi:hypothetical protein
MSLRDDLVLWADPQGTAQWVDNLGDPSNLTVRLGAVFDDNYASFKMSVKDALGLVEDDVNNTTTFEFDQSQVKDEVVQLSDVEEW